MYFIYSITYLIIILCFLLFFIFFNIFWFSQIRYSMNKNRIVYVPTKSKKVLKEIRNYLQESKINTEEYHLVELGSGLANVISWLTNQFKFKKTIGVEVNWMIYLFAKFIFFFKKTKIEFINKDVFDYEIPEKSVVYCYLTDQIITNLYQKGALKNTIFFSLTFAIKDVEPAKKIQLDNFYKNLYIYDFN